MQEMQTRMNRVYRNGRTFLLWILGSLLIGVVCGAVGTAFHLAVDWATEARLENGWLLYLLPAAGLVIAAAYRWANIEGAGALPSFALVCSVCYMLFGHYSLYSGSQYILFSKTKWEAEKDHA